MIKVMVLLRRPASWTRERFHRWWLDEHVAYGKKLPDLRKYRVAANYSSRMRPLLLNVYAAADALPMTPLPAPTTRTGVLVRVQEPLHVHMEPYAARLPPRWNQVGYRSIFAAQGAGAKPAYRD